jgi:hypothetical protein
MGKRTNDWVPLAGILPVTPTKAVGLELSVTVASFVTTVGGTVAFGKILTSCMM